jgi:hypothetical protein
MSFLAEHHHPKSKLRRHRRFPLSFPVNGLNTFKDVQYTWYSEPIEHLNAILSAIHNPGVFQACQVFGDRGYVGSNQIRQLADGSFTV